jgi:excisionase family DNA binding protein
MPHDPEQLTPRQVARAIGVSDATLKRWCDKGLIRSVRTAGGHRRLPLSGVLEFLRASGYAPVRPEVLGLPSTTGTGQTVRERAAALLFDALVQGDEEQFARIVTDLYLAGLPLREICDRMIARAFSAIGAAWERGELEIYQERRGCEICLRVLHRMRMMLPPPGSEAPYALGGAPAGDCYALATLMVELTLRELGWRAESFGTDLPLESVARAVRRMRPRLVWLSISTAAPEALRLEGFDRLREAAEELDVAVVVGGQGLSPEVRSRMRGATICENCGELASFAGTLVPSRPG